MNNKTQQKKDREKFFLEQFLQRRGIAPINITASERPDFMMLVNGRTVGVEVTEIFVQGSEGKPHPQSPTGLPLQAIETYTDAIVSKAQKVYLGSDSPFVSAKIIFSNGLTYAMNRDRVAEVIAHRIICMSSQTTASVEWRPGTQADENDLLCESVNSIRISRVPYKRFARWMVPRVGLVTSLKPKHLQDAINQKGTKIEAYRKNADELWLLMFADRAKPSQMLKRQSGFCMESLSSPFDKTFYYCHLAGETIVEF